LSPQFKVMQEWWERTLQEVENAMDGALLPDEVYRLNLHRKTVKAYLGYMKRMLEAIGVEE